MGLKHSFAGRNGSGPGELTVRERFGAYFPRLFAYVRSWTGDDAAASDITVEAFCRAFGRPAASPAEFRSSLFSAAFQLCRRLRPAAPRGDGLSRQERDLLGLLFDARLSRDEVSALLNADRRSVTSTLISGLAKLRKSAPGAAIAGCSIQGG